jgi:hypothetical protein
MGYNIFYNQVLQPHLVQNTYCNKAINQNFSTLKTLVKLSLREQSILLNNFVVIPITLRNDVK